MSGASADSFVWQARKLLRAARYGTLATVTEGQPFASLVTPASTPELSVLLFLSQLSEHTRHLRAEPRCALLVAGEAESVNPQTTPRLTVTGIAETLENPALKARWLAIHPYAGFYADFADFSLWRIRIGGGLIVAGFGRASRLRAADLLPDPGATAAVAAQEPEILARCNADHAAALEALGEATAGGARGPWRMVAVDVDGCDLEQNQRVIRIPWSSPVADADGVRRELLRLVQAARGS
jgi:hypothetical protein